MFPDQPLDEEPTPQTPVPTEDVRDIPTPLPLPVSDTAQNTQEVEDEIDDDDEEDDDDFEDEEEDEAEYAEFTKLDPDFAHRREIITRYLNGVHGPLGKRRRRAASTIDFTKTAAERELAQKQQYADWEREGIAWFNEQHATGRFDEWLGGYHLDSTFAISSFAKSYGSAYADFRAYGSSFAGWLDSQKLQFRDAAVKLLWQIQQKKLFDLQCRWRAGQVTVPGLDISEDFDYWNDRLYRCTFLPPITDEEFALYRAYAESADFEEDEDCSQDYERFKQEQTSAPDDGAVEMPEWYQFHNVRTGNGSLLLLPNLRGEREAHYRAVYNAYWLARHEAEKASKGEPAAPPPLPPPPADPRPRLLWYDYYQGQESNRDHVAHDFLRRFAPEPGVLQHLKAVSSTRFDDRSDVQEAFELLLEVREPVRIEAHANWREAIQLTAARYQREQTIAALDVVYDDYKMREQFGLAHTPYSEYPASSRAQLLVERLDILKGRILCGEPPTFDY